MSVALAAESAVAIETTSSPYGPATAMDLGFTTPCLVWNGAKTKDGYGVKWVAGKALYVHRLAYQANGGALVPGQELDHICHSYAEPKCFRGRGDPHRACFRADHLQQVTHDINNLRSSRLCGIARVEDQLDPINQDRLQHMLTNQWITAQHLSDQLAKAGFRVSKYVIGKHRRGACSCPLRRPATSPGRTLFVVLHSKQGADQ